MKLAEASLASRLPRRGRTQEGAAVADYFANRTTIRYGTHTIANRLLHTANSSRFT